MARLYCASGRVSDVAAYREASYMEMLAKGDMKRSVQARRKMGHTQEWVTGACESGDSGRKACMSEECSFSVRCRR